MAQAHPMLAPYQPSAEDPFDSIKAAHLLNRAGFGESLLNAKVAAGAVPMCVGRRLRRQY